MGSQVVLVRNIKAFILPSLCVCMNSGTPGILQVSVFLKILTPSINAWAFSSQQVSRWGSNPQLYLNTIWFDRSGGILAHSMLKTEGQGRKSINVHASYPLFRRDLRGLHHSGNPVSGPLVQCNSSPSQLRFSADLVTLSFLRCRLEFHLYVLHFCK